MNTGRLIAVVVLASLVGGLAQTGSSTQQAYVDLPILGVDIPKTVRFNALLTMKMTAEGGGCGSYDRMTVERDFGRLDIRIQRRRPVSTAPEACNMASRPFPIIYSESLASPLGIRGMGSVIEISVNGRKAGDVQVVRQ